MKSYFLKLTLFAFTCLLMLPLQAQLTGLNVGNIAPELLYKAPNGKRIALSSLRGQMVLIDFWAAWCGPCRRENPNIVAAYHKYKDQNFKAGSGFTVYSVSLDRTKDAWVQGITEDQLEWPNHVSDLKYMNSKAAQLYQLAGIPANFLIDGNGVIVAKNLRGNALDEQLYLLLKAQEQR